MAETDWASLQPTVWNVFTPSTPARLSFVERDSINERIVDALRTPGKQIVVYGHSGSGKTTLVVNKLHQLYESHITSRCVRNLSFEALVLDAFDQLGVFYQSSKLIVRKHTVSNAVEALYSGIKLQLGASRSTEATETAQRMLPPQLTIQNLARMIGAAGCCWVLEDFHKLLDAEKLKMAQALKVFMDMAYEYPAVRVIVIGAVSSAREVINCEPELTSRLTQVHVPLMEREELIAIVRKGEQLLNVRFPKQLQRGIVRYSSGLAAVCHQLCLNICLAASISEPSLEALDVPFECLDAALRRYVDDSSDTLKQAFDRALRQRATTKYADSKLLIAAMTQCDPDGAPIATLLAIIRRDIPEYRNSNLSRSLRRLQLEEQGGLIVYDPAAGKYRFSDPIFRVFAMTTKMAATVQAVDVEILHDLGMLDFREVSSDFARILRSEFTDDA